MKFPSRNEHLTSLFTPVPETPTPHDQNLEAQTVGKNHVIIPVLHLPNKNTTQVIIEEEKV
jgi:hypothetical protein